MRSAVTIASAPHYRKHDYESLIWMLDMQTAELRPPVPHTDVPPEQRDPQAAAAWFRAMGMHVVDEAVETP